MQPRESTQLTQTSGVCLQCSASTPLALFTREITAA